MPVTELEEEVEEEAALQNCPSQAVEAQEFLVTWLYKLYNYL